MTRQFTPKATLTSDNAPFYGYLIALYTSYENKNVFAGNNREETMQSADIQFVMDYRAFFNAMMCVIFI